MSRKRCKRRFVAPTINQSINQSIKNKYLSVPRNRFKDVTIYLPCPQLSSYKYFVFATQSKSNIKICTIEKISFKYYLK